MYERPLCDGILWVIYQTSALNQAHHVNFTRSTVRPRCLAVFPPFSTLIGFQESGPSPLFATRQACGPCSLYRGGI